MKSAHITMITLTSLSVLGLAGCGSSSTHETSSMNDATEIFSQESGSEPSSLPASLEGEINALFATSDQEPVVIESGETINALIARL